MSQLRTKVLQFYEFDTIDALNDQEKHHVRLAQRQTENAYAPYSNFKVGAVIALKNGTTVLGSNQENIAYPSGLCAERVALFAAGANHKDCEIESIFIASSGNLISAESIVTPCGACRQVMHESEIRQENEIKVFLIGRNGKVIRFDRIADLLPFAFGTF